MKKLSKDTYLTNHKLVLGGLLLAACTEVTPGIDDMNPADGDGDLVGDGDSEATGGTDASSGGNSNNADGAGGHPHNLGGAQAGDVDPALERCAFSGFDGMGGGPGGGDPITIAENSFLGEVLFSADGLALYTYGADRPGTCDTAPLEGCSADCAIAWPPFFGDLSGLAEGLDPADFGTFLRADGGFQTTFRGWPLYLYKKDEVPFVVAGQGKGKIWHAAGPRKTEIMILRNEANEKYLVDELGFTLYVLDGDTIGTADEDPVALCSEECLEVFVPFRGTHLTVATSLNQTEFAIFTSPGIGRQVAYRGQPLYLHVDDEKPFDVKGLGEFGAQVTLF